LKSPGSTILREIELATNTFSIRTDGNTATTALAGVGSPIERGLDRSIFLLLQANAADGPILTYDAATDTFPSRDELGSYNNNRASAVSRDGQLLALEVSNHVAVVDRNFHAVENLPGISGGIIFDPTRDLLYGVNRTTNQIVAYNTTTWQEQFWLSTETQLVSPASPDLMAVSSDGEWLFLSTPSGVRMYDLPTAPGMAARFELTGFPRFIRQGIEGTFTITAKDDFGQTATGYSGTVRFNSTDPAAALPAEYIRGCRSRLSYICCRLQHHRYPLFSHIRYSQHSAGVRAERYPRS
jgi:hypothetical protein